MTRKLMIGVVLVALGCTGEAPREPSGPKEVPTNSPKTYQVQYLSEVKIQIDGVLNEPEWQKAGLETGFTFPWRDREPPRTEFRAVCDDEFLYFIFIVEDEDIVIDEKTEGEKALIGEDRVEFYFAPDLDLEEYYCVEMDFQGRRLDYKASFHRKFDFSWKFPDIKTAGTRTPKGYVVEGSIPLETLESLGLPSLDSGGLRVGVYRAEFSHGDGPEPIENWISWIDPKTKEEDFHIPGTLGIFKSVK